MRGLGGGYTQILLNGEPLPAGFSIESISPEQVDRIEILRAPTAEYGARAIAGTINIVLREASMQRQSGLRAGFASERGRIQPGAAWNLTDRLTGDAESTDNYSLTLTALRLNRLDEIDNHTRVVDADSSSTVLERQESGMSRFTREFINFSGRVNLRHAHGNTFSLQPFVQLFQTERYALSTLSQGGSGTPPWTRTTNVGSNRSAILRLAANWLSNLSDETRLDLKIGTGYFAFASDDHRERLDSTILTQDDDTTLRECAWNLGGKVTHELLDGHSLVVGAEAAQVNRNEGHGLRLNNVSHSTGDGENVGAGVRRVAVYVQDEWQPAPRWSTYAGLRWEGIATRSRTASDNSSNRSGVWTPLLHAVWKPYEERRDQLRMSLTRSYRAPTLQNLVSAYAYSTTCPLGTAQTASCPDRVGNPDLRPELATGLEIGYERYVGERGLMSINLFHRRIRDLIRSLTAWSADEGRFVTKPQNIGNATTQGVELEVKLRVSDLLAGAPGTNLRGNASLFRSGVDSVPGPDNRLEQQPRATANIGIDHRFSPVPVLVGVSLNWTPAYAVRVSDNQTNYAGLKRTIDFYGVVPLNSQMQLRLIGSNLFPLRYPSGGSNTYLAADSPLPRPLLETLDTVSTTYTQWQLRLEVKL